MKSKMNIQRQVQQNRKIINRLPIHTNFAYVWQPETLDYRLSAVYQSYDTGISIQNPEVLT